MNRILPAGVSVFERGWLSSNNILLTDPEQTLLIDSGYATHSDQTVSLVGRSLGSRPLDGLYNTHLHSDHCGGNAALQIAYPALQTAVPAGMAHEVRNWDAQALGYVPTGQECPCFVADTVLQPGGEFRAAGRAWQVHASPGHDPHSLIFFEPQSAALVSADALWEGGFGVVFQELEGEHAFDQVAQTLDLIERLRPAVVIPGHGAVFTSVATALETARKRLDGFARNPQKHARHAAKVLLKFKLLDARQMTEASLLQWTGSTPYIGMVARTWFTDVPVADFVRQLADDLVRSGAARREGELLLNA